MNPILNVKNLNSHYGKSHILQGISFRLNKGDCLALLGRNGAGKTTTLRSIVNLKKPSSGIIEYYGKSIINVNPYVISKSGITLVPENRGVLKTLTVGENLKIVSSNTSNSNWDIPKVIDLFPVLKSKFYNNCMDLSGGEQQMLAIARALLLNPQLLLLDEPSQGLAPKIIIQIEEILQSLINNKLSIILVEQNLSLALNISTHISIIGKGSSVWNGKTSDFTKNSNKYKDWISV